MKRKLNQAILCLACSFVLSLPATSFAQVNSSFTIDNTTSSASVAKMFSLSGNRIGILMFDATGVNLWLRTFDASGTLVTNANITSLINWNHNTHGGVVFNAIQLNNGNIFITHVANTNSTGIQTYNARFTVITESGTSVSSGQLNSTDAANSYIQNILLDKLTDGKIVTVFRKTTGDNLTFRLFNATGTSFGNDVAFSGQGTANSFANTYTFALAAGRWGNFIITAYFWDGALRGFVYNNSGVNATAGGATHFMVDATSGNNYGNMGVVGLPNGNFAAAWYYSNIPYIKVMSNNGTTVVARQQLTAGSYTSIVPATAPGSEGFYMMETRQQAPGVVSNPNAGLFVNRFNQAGALQSTVQSADGWLIRPTFYLVPGVAGGYASAASYFRTFTTNPMMGNMAMPTGDNDISAQMVDFSMATLPVVLTSYNITLTNTNQIQLSWKTVSEENNSHFEIERSTDGRDYSVIGRVAASGMLNGGASYSFSDPVLFSQTTYYRLKQFDIDGRMKDLGVKFIRKDIGKVLPSVYPNPVLNGKMILSAGSEPLPFLYKIFDMQGRVVSSGSLTQPKQEINIEKLTGGTYLIQAGTETIRIQRK